MGEMPRWENYVRIKAEPEDLTTMLEWLRGLGPDVSATVRPQPDKPEIQVLHIEAPFTAEVENDVQLILSKWELEHPGAIQRDWLEEES